MGKCPGKCTLIICKSASSIAYVDHSELVQCCTNMTLYVASGSISMVSFPTMMQRCTDVLAQNTSTCTTTVLTEQVFITGGLGCTLAVFHCINAFMLHVWNFRSTLKCFLVSVCKRIRYLLNY